MDLFCCCCRFSIDSVFPRLLNKNTGTYLEGYQFLCQAQTHRLQHCLLERGTDKDVNRVTPALLYCLKIVNLVLEDLNFLLLLYTWNMVELHFILFIIML